MLRSLRKFLFGSTTPLPVPEASPAPPVPPVLPPDLAGAVEDLPKNHL